MLIQFSVYARNCVYIVSTNLLNFLCEDRGLLLFSFYTEGNKLREVKIYT